MSKTKKPQACWARKSLRSIKGACTKNGFTIDQQRYDQGGDHILIYGQFGGYRAKILYNTFNAKFFGETEHGRRFDSDSTQYDGTVWFQRMLRFFYKPAKSTKKAAAIIAMLCLLPCAAQANSWLERLSSEEEARLTRGSPYFLDCREVRKGYYDCGEVERYEAPAVRADYLPPVVPEQRAKIAPLLTSMFGAINNVCRKVGKNSEYCQELGRHGADEIGAQLAAGDQ